MARCPLCESDVPDGRTDCDACGQPFDQPPTVQAGAGEVKTDGMDTETFRRNVEQAGAIASRGDHASAERLLKRVSLRSLDERRENALHTSLEKAEARIRYSKERGGTVGDAEAFLQEARKALAVREYGKIRTLTSKAVETAESQRRRARMEGFLDRASSEVDLARNEGIDIGEARKLLTQAREATLIKTVRDAFASLQMDRDDLKNLGADIAGFEQTLVQLGAAIEGQDVGAARRLVAEARHTAETARDAHFRAVMENSLQIV